MNRLGRSTSHHSPRASAAVRVGVLGDARDRPRSTPGRRRPPVRVVHRAQDVAGGADVPGGQQPHGLADGGAAQRQVAHLVLVAGARADRLGEDRRVGGDPDDAACSTIGPGSPDWMRARLRSSSQTATPASASCCKALAITAPVMLDGSDATDTSRPAGLARRTRTLQTLPGGAHHRLGGDVELLVDVGDLPGFAEAVHADEAALRGRGSGPSSSAPPPRPPRGRGVAQHGLLVGRILLVEDQARRASTPRRSARPPAAGPSLPRPRGAVPSRWPSGSACAGRPRLPAARRRRWPTCSPCPAPRRSSGIGWRDRASSAARRGLSRTISQHSAVSTGSPGRYTARCGMARSADRCSTG